MHPPLGGNHGQMLLPGLARKQHLAMAPLGSQAAKGQIPPWGAIREVGRASGQRGCIVETSDGALPRECKRLGHIAP